MPVDEIGREHHAGIVVRTQRQHPPREDLRNVVEHDLPGPVDHWRGVRDTTSAHWFHAGGARSLKKKSTTSHARSRQPRRTNAATLRHS